VSGGRARRLGRDLLPPAVVRALAGRPAGQLVFEDGFDSWAAAGAAAGGYDAAAILDQVRRATDEVVAGRSAMERDGVLFDRVEVRWPVAGPLLWQAATHAGSLRVLDFGGSLGSTYRQLSALTFGLEVQWAVVEQPAFVEAGAGYADGRLSFHATIGDAVRAVTPTVALLSSVLQYLPDPQAVLGELSRCGVEAIVLDRMPMTDADTDRPAVERVPPEIYAGSYATWLLSQERLLAAAPGWRVLDRFPGIEPAGRTTTGVAFDWRGFVLVPE
jgi:putative methyltransferase (TIGR04325 family)